MLKQRVEHKRLSEAAAYAKAEQEKVWAATTRKRKHEDGTSPEHRRQIDLCRML
jgi:hypothetical protein